MTARMAVSRSVGEKVRLFRKRRDLTQAELAMTVGMVQQTIARIEKGLRGVSVDDLTALAAGLDVGLVDLLPSSAKNGSHVHPTAVIGDPPEHRGYEGAGIAPLISPDARIEALVTVDAGIREATYVGPRVWLMKKVHVGHDAMIWSGSEIAPLCSIGGHVQIGQNVRIGQGATLKPYVKVGDDARIGMGAVVICDVPEGEVWAGNPARCIHKATERMMTDAELEGWEEWWRASRA